MLVQRKSVQNVQERRDTYTGFVKVNIEISKNIKLIEIAKCFQGNLETRQRTLFAHPGGR